MDNSRAHLVITGLVQGVWYRAYTERTANALGLTGWVSNSTDGSVEAVMEGSRAAIDMAVLECKKGSQGSRVDNVEVTYGEARGEFDSFKIKH